jgi:integrase
MASFTQTPAGSWRVQIEHRGRREYKTFKNKSLATRWATQREAELQRGLIASSDDAQKTALSEIIEIYREKELPKKRNRSDKYMLNTLDRRFGRTRLISLVSRDIADFRDDRLKEAAPATVLKELNLLRVLIDYAIKDLSIHLPSNQARLVKNPKVANSRDRVFLEDEEERLLAAMTNPNLAAIAKLALATAARLGELLKMQWADIDFQHRTLHFPSTKTDKPRTIPLSPAAMAVLKGMPRPSRGGRVFDCWVAGDSFENAYKRAIKRARKKYEEDCTSRNRDPDPRILTDLRFHDFRHIATSRLAKVLPNVIELSMVTGHSDLKMLKRYYHVTPAELARRLAGKGR